MDNDNMNFNQTPDINRYLSIDSSGEPVLHTFKELWNNKYVVFKTIYKSQYGGFYCAINVENKQNLTIKYFDNTPKANRYARKEIEFLSGLTSPDVKASSVAFVEHFQHNGHQCLVLEETAPSLDEFLRDQDVGLPLNTSAHVAFQLMEFLGAYLDKDPRGTIVHNNIQPSSIVFCTFYEISPKIKLVEFGAARFEQNQVPNVVQPLNYRAPEVLLGFPYDETIDVWSVGCTMFECFSGHALFPGKDETDQLMRIIEVLGMPPDHMIERSPKKDLYFVLTNKGYVPKMHSRSNYFKPGTKTFEIMLGLSSYSNPSVDLLEFIYFLKGLLTYEPELRMKPKDVNCYALPYIC